MWYVMQVYTGMEMEVCQQCRRRIMEEDEEIFVMLAERMTKMGGEWSLVTGRLFPGYVFVETNRIEDFYIRLRNAGSLARVLHTGEEMTSIYPEEENYLRMLGGEEHVIRYSQGYIEGEELVVTSGAMKMWRGKVKKVLRHKRLVVIEMPLMGRVVEVTVGMGIVSRQGNCEIVKVEGRQE